MRSDAVLIVTTSGSPYISDCGTSAIEKRRGWPREAGPRTRAIFLIRPLAHREWLPKYAPELNDIERVWHDFKAQHLAHQTFADPGELEHAIHQAVGALNVERTTRTTLPLAALRISA